MAQGARALAALLVVAATALPTAHSYSVGCKVFNGVNENAISGAICKLTLNGSPAADPITTASNGAATFAGSDYDGEYVVSAAADGFYTILREIVVDADMTDIRIFLSPILSASTSYRAILSWQSTPPDLDSYLLFRDGEFPCTRVNWQDRLCEHGTGSVVLDVDVTSGYGPETISFESLSAGYYSYVVDMWTSSGTFAASQAIVSFFGGSGAGAFMTYNAPKDTTNRAWHVFDLEVEAQPDGCLHTYMLPVDATVAGRPYNGDTELVAPTGSRMFVSSSCGAASLCSDSSDAPELPDDVCDCLGSNRFHDSNSDVDLASTTTWGETLGASLTDLLDNALGVDEIEDAFQAATYGANSIDGSAVADAVAASLAAKFADKRAIAEALRDEVTTLLAAEAAGNGGSDEYTECCTLDLSTNEPDFRFGGAQVDDTKTCARIPVSVTNAGDLTGIQRDVRGSSGAVMTMKTSLMDSKGLAWQYFGAQSGLMSIFPAVGRRSCGDYDPRFRPWYVLGATPEPRDIVVVLDKSGSMSDFNRIGVARDAAASVLETLSPLDYVNVVTFQSEVSTPGEDVLMHSCFETLLAPAEPANVHDLGQFVANNVCPLGGTNYLDALSTAYTMLSATRDAGLGTGGKQVILFLSDGAPDASAGVLDLINAQTAAEGGDNTHLFTFGLGSELDGDDRAFLQSMADAGNGLFVFVPDNGDLRTAMGSYYSFFVRVSNEEQQVAFTLPYLFSNGGLGVTGAVSVRWPDNSLAGVVGVDMMLDELLEDVTYLDLGELSYAFIIDGNGKTLVHPNLPTPTTWQSDPVFLHISNLEGENFRTTVLSQMISDETGVSDGGSATITTSRALPRGDASGESSRTVSTSATYTWKRVDGTDYLAVVVVSADDASADVLSAVPAFKSSGSPEDIYHRIDVAAQGQPGCFIAGVRAASDVSSFKLAPKAFDKPYEYLNNRESATCVGAIRAKVNGETLSASENQCPLPTDRAVLDVKASGGIESFWESTSDSTNVQRYTLWRFVGTAGGVFRTFPAHASSRSYDPRQRPWYVAGLSNAGEAVLTTPYVAASVGDLVVTMSHTIESASGDVMGVAGVDFTVGRVATLVSDASSGLCDGSDISCMVLDAGGYFVWHPSFKALAAGSGGHSGSVFVGDLEPELAKYLVEERSFLAPSYCNDYTDNTRRLSYVAAKGAGSRFSLTASGPGESGATYHVVPIDGANSVLVVKSGGSWPDAGCHCDTSCHCPTTDVFFDGTTCDTCSTSGGLTCQCPCKCEMAANPCESTFEDTDTPSCPAPLPTATADAEISLDNTLAERNLASCVDYDRLCTGIMELEPVYGTLEDMCVATLGCGWCASPSGNHYCQPSTSIDCIDRIGGGRDAASTVHAAAGLAALAAVVVVAGVRLARFE